MPNHRAEKRWDHPTYRWAYVREYRDAACTVIHGSPPKTTGYKFVPTARTKVMKILDERLEAYQRSQAGLPEERESRATYTVEEVFDEFVRVRWPRITKHQQLMYTRYLDVIPGNLFVDDTTAIRKAVEQGIKHSGYATNTQHKAYQMIRTVFQFAVEDGRCRVNPIRKDMIPPYKAPTPQPYKDHQVAKLFRELQGVNLYIAWFLSGSACRPVETTTLYWRDVHDTYCVLHSKKGNDQTPRPRIIPYALCLFAKFAIDAMRPTDGSTPHPDTLVFGRKNYTTCAWHVKQILGDENTGLYGFRKHTINYWVDQRWPEDIRYELAGHSKAIAKEAYEERLRVDQLVRFTLDSLASNRT